MSNTIFVYGTLKKGFALNEMLENSKFLGSCKTRDKYSLYVSNGIPYLHDDNPLFQIEGELYSVDAETLAFLDQIEGNGEWYHRRDIIILLDNCEIISQAYFNNSPGKLLLRQSF